MAEFFPREVKPLPASVKQRLTRFGNKTRLSARRAAVRFLLPLDTLANVTDVNQAFGLLLLRAKERAGNASPYANTTRITGVQGTQVQKGLFSRIAELTGVSEERLTPVVYEGDSRGVANLALGYYLPKAHAVFSGSKESSIIGKLAPKKLRREHENLHAAQILLMSDHSATPVQRFKEPMALFRTPWLPPAGQLIFLGAVASIAAKSPQARLAIQGAGAAGTLVGVGRTLVFRSLLLRKRYDEVIALMMLPYVEPLLARSHLRELEKRGFLKNGVFTAKGEKWVARRKSGIEAFLARAEQNREAMRLQ